MPSYSIVLKKSIDCIKPAQWCKHFACVQWKCQSFLNVFLNTKKYTSAERLQLLRTLRVQALDLGELINILILLHKS